MASKTQTIEIGDRRYRGTVDKGRGGGKSKITVPWHPDLAAGLPVTAEDVSSATVAAVGERRKDGSVQLTLA